MTIAVASIGLLASIATVPAHAGIGDGGSSIVGDWEALDTDDGTGSPYPGTWSEAAAVTPSLTSGFDSATTAHLTWNAGSGVGGWEGEFSPNLGTSLEIENLGLELQANSGVAVNWTLTDGAAYTAGGPRIFVEIDGVYYNSFGNVDSGEDGATIFGLPAGTVGHVGVAYDNGVSGTVNLGVFHFFDSTGDVQVLYPDGSTTGPEANEFGQSVAAYVKENGGPPPHANAKANR
jgi:hypothetical protein